MNQSRELEQLNVRIPAEMKLAIQADARRRNIGANTLVQLLWRAEELRQRKRQNAEYKLRRNRDAKK